MQWGEVGGVGCKVLHFQKVVRVGGSGGGGGGAHPTSREGRCTSELLLCFRVLRIGVFLLFFFYQQSLA